MDAFTIASLIALGVVIVELIKPYVPSKVPTLPVAWAVNIALVFIASASSVFKSQELFGYPIGGLDWQAKVLGGLMIASTGSVAIMFRKAFDNSDTAVTEKGTAYTKSGE